MMTVLPVASVAAITSLRLVRAHVWRATLVWTAVRVFIGAATGDFTALDIRGSIILSATAAAIAYYDARRRRELTFLGNLGVSSIVPSAVAATTVAILELLAQLALAAVRQIS